MIPENIIISNNLAIKDSFGRKIIILSSADSKYFKVESDYLREEEIKRRFFEWTEEDEKRTNSQSFVTYPRKSAWYCIFCGKEMWQEQNDGMNGPEFLHCRDCDAQFTVHYPNDAHRRAGESFSLTYWH